jgi:hypothetical protein
METKPERVACPQVGDVIVCEAFARGWKRLLSPSEAEDAPMWVTDLDLSNAWPNGARQDHHDPSRASAPFVVEACEVPRYGASRVTWKDTSRGGGYGDPFTYEEEKHGYALRVTARRLAADGSYDPDGERIRFEVWGHGPGNHGPSERDCLASARKIGAFTLAQAVLDAPILKLRFMRPVLRFE